MEVSRLFHLLSLIFLLWFTGSVWCKAIDKEVYNLCMPKSTIVTPDLKTTGQIQVTEFDRNWFENEMPCKIVFHLCKACQLSLYFNSSNLGRNRVCYPQISSHCYQDCVYLRVVDETYNQSHAFLFRPGDNFTSLSNVVSVTLCNTFRRHSRDLQFQVDFKVESKIQKIYPLQSKTFQSPGFPSGYAINGEEFLYEIIKPNLVGEMLIIFTDWIVSPWSKLVVYSATGTQTFFGNGSRPVFVREKTFQLIFSTGSKRSLLYSDIVRGFRAEIILKNSVNIPQSIPNIKCGQSVIQMNFGGLLKFQAHEDATYDCVWVIFLHPTFRLLTVQLVKFDAQPSSYVNFYEGLTSEGRLVRTIFPGQQHFTYQTPNGFYIRLKGVMNTRNVFSLIYTSSNPTVNSCPYTFKCKTGFCIESSLRCDGINNCLDKSDETNCFEDKNDRTSTHLMTNWSVSIIIPVVITIFIFIIICLFFIFIRRFRKISRGSASHRQRNVATVSGNVSQNYMQSHFSMNVTHEELDAPPSYEEVMNTPSPRGNCNLAFNWSQQDIRDIPAPPPYSEYMRENSTNTYNTNNDISDLSTIPTDTSSSNNCTDPTSEDQNSICVPGSRPDLIYSENIFGTMCDTTTNSLDRWMVDRSTSTSEEGIELDEDNYDKIAVDEPVMMCMPDSHEVSTETPSLRKNISDAYQLDRNNSDSALPGAEATKSSFVFGEFDPIARENPKNKNDRRRPLSAERDFLRANRSRSVDLVPESVSNPSLDILHRQNTAQNAKSKNSTFFRRNSYPSILILSDRQLKSEVFV